MTFSILLIFPILLIFTLFLFISLRTHLLMVLLATESIMLMMMTSIMLSHALTTQANAYLLFLLLTLGACEASLGLAIMVAMSRSSGSDMLTTLSLNKC